MTIFLEVSSQVKQLTFVRSNQFSYRADPQGRLKYSGDYVACSLIIVTAAAALAFTAALPLRSGLIHGQIARIIPPQPQRRCCLSGAGPRE